MNVHVPSRWVRPKLGVRVDEAGVRFEADRLPVGNVLLRLFVSFAVAFPWLSTSLAVYAMDGEPAASVLSGAVVQLLSTPFWLFIAWVGGLVTEHWEVVEFDGSTARLSARSSGRFVWLSRSLEVPFSHIRGIEVAVERAGRGEGSRRLGLEIRHRDPANPSGDGERRESFRGRLEAVPAGETAEDLIGRIATTLGWRELESPRRGRRETRIELSAS